ncbi:MAG: hypothetical protein ACO1QS_01320 [Verrucomicrobiota bacterium]
MSANHHRPLASLCLIALLLATVGCQTLNPTREQQLKSLEKKENKTPSETDYGSAVSLVGNLLHSILPFISK